MLIINTIRHWLIHLFTPHCPECLELQLELRTCPNCETLKQIIETNNAEKRQLMNLISELNSKTIEPIASNENESTPLIKRPLTWRHQRQVLEQNSRVEALKARSALDDLKRDGSISTEKLVENPSFAEVPQQSIEDLEKELGVIEDAASN